MEVYANQKQELMDFHDRLSDLNARLVYSDDEKLLYSTIDSLCIWNENNSVQETNDSVLIIQIVVPQCFSLKFSRSYRSQGQLHKETDKIQIRS